MSTTVCEHGNPVYARCEECERQAAAHGTRWLPLAEALFTRWVTNRNCPEGPAREAAQSACDLARLFYEVADERDDESRELEAENYRLRELLAECSPLLPVSHTGQYLQARIRAALEGESK